LREKAANAARLADKVKNNRATAIPESSCKGHEVTNPYRGKPDFQFWRKSVAAPAATDVDPIVNATIRIGSDTRIATAGSCFAQHIARTLVSQGFDYMISESKPAFTFSQNENYGTFSARYGNIYTVRQLLQLFERAYALHEPEEVAWRREDGRYVDPFRPQIQSAGFETIEQLVEDREAHLAAVRAVFEDCNVFIFTLGLTEAWISRRDGAVYPLAPGVVSPHVDPESYTFHNFNVAEIQADLVDFLQKVKKLNPKISVLLTVSPVPLIATYEHRHALTATTYSKSVLRVVADQVASQFEWVEYFPSYEMVTGIHTRGAFFAEDLREVTPEGVAYVMRMFSRHYLNPSQAAPSLATSPQLSDHDFDEKMKKLRELSTIICDETLIEESL
jgi:hypothetical protein